MAGPNFNHLSIIDHEEISDLRTKINKSIHSICKIMIEANVIPVVTYTSSPIRGGVSEDIDLLNNIFNLHQYRVSPQQIVDCIDKAIGVYSYDKIPSTIRIFNPIFWLLKFSDVIFNIFFDLLQNAGFNTKEIENSLIVKLLKIISNFLISILTILILYLKLLTYL